MLIIEQLIYNRVEPIIDPLLPKNQVGFRHEKSTIYQVILLTQNIEYSFEAKNKAGTVFVDLTTAYDTVWHGGSSAGQQHNLDDHGTCSKQKLHPDHW